MNRAFTNVLCDDVDTTAQFYQDLLGLKRNGDFGWFVLLGSERLPGFELGILNRNHETVPKAEAQVPQGVILTFVVDDVEAAFARAKAMDADIIEGPTDLPYGQRRVLIRDPSGVVVDVSAPVAQA